MMRATIYFVRTLAAIVAVLAGLGCGLAISMVLLQLGFDIMGDVAPNLIALHLQHNFAGVMICGGFGLPALAIFAVLTE